MLRIVLAVMMVTAIVGVVGLLVLPPVAAQGSPNAGRSFDNMTVEPGEDVQVTIAVSNYGGAGAISEMLPSGFTYKTSSLTRRGSGQELRFILTGQTSLTYTVTASSVEGDHTFSGVLKRVGETDFPIGGPSSVTVQAASGSTPSAERSFDNMTVEPGEDVQVTIAVSNYGGAGAISEMLPSGFTYKTSSLTRRGSGQELRFILTGQTSLTYTVTASSVEGDHTFSGVLKRVGETDVPIGGPSSVTVQAASGSTPSAERSFDNMTVEPGEDVQVTIAVSNYGGAGAISEMLPSGFTYKTSSLTRRGSGQELRFILTGQTSLTYTVTASSVEGDHTFSGVLKRVGETDFPIGGPSSVTVEAAAPPPEAEPSAIRSFDKTTVEPGENVKVTITVENYGAAGGVTETLPVGFSYVSSSLDSEQVMELSGNQVRFTLQGETSFTYTVTASSVERFHTFSGTLRDIELDDYPVGGATRVTVRAPQPVNRAPVFRSVAAVSVAENTTTVVRVRATDSDSRDTVTGYAIRGGADSGKFSIVAATGELSFTTVPDFENPADAGANNEYVVTVRATSGGVGRARTATQTITVTVVNVDEMGTVTLSSTAPGVGAAITASVTDPDGVVTGETWQWARSADGSTGWADTGATSAAYTPVQADEDNYLRATASYADGEGSGKSAEAVSDNAVAVASAGVPGDTNNDGRIDKPEVIAAYRAYVADPSDKTEMIAIFRQYVADSVSSQ